MNVAVSMDSPVTAKVRRMIELARSHYEAGGVNAAADYYRMILKDTSPPKNGVERVAHGEACLWYARKALHDKHVGEAADWYQRAINADPLAVEYRIEYCIKALLPMAAFKMARIEAETATKIEPDNAKAWRTLAGIEHTLGNVAAAIAGYDRQLELTSDPRARLDRATIALDTADYNTVREMCTPALSDQDCRADAMLCLAMADYREGKHEQAIELYDRAIALGCYDPELAIWNKSLALHSIGRYKEGWAAHEARGRQITDGGMALVMNRFTAPRWDGKTPGRVHIHQEMGHGDVIAMARYVPLVQEMGCEVSLEVLEPMVSLMARSFPGVRVVPRAKNYPGAIGLPLFDFHVPMLTLPAIFGTDVDTVPWRGLYLKTDPELVARHRDLLPANKRKIGLCWSSGIRNDGLWLSEYGRRKSMAFETLRPVFLQQVQRGDATHIDLWTDRADDCFVSLQVGPEARECRSPVISLLPEKPNWDDTAALIECLDIIVTVDTSVAHLAGALGKPVMLMMHTEGSWHWMTERLDSPWYPMAKIYRQEKVHEWEGVVDHVARDLHA